MYWLTVLLTLGFALAEEPAAPVVPATTEAPAEVAPIAPPVAKKKKGARVEVKENEGTEALDRFEANTILKSQYHLNGQPLEIDPD